MTAGLNRKKHDSDQLTLSLVNLGEVEVMEIDLRQVFDSMPWPVVIARRGERADYLNYQWCCFTGHSTDASQGYSWEAAIHLDDLPTFHDAWAELGNRREKRITARLRRRDGEYVWFNFSLAAIPCESEQPKRLCAIGFKLDTRLPAEVHAYPGEQYLWQFSDNLPVQFVFLSPGGEVQFVNREVESYYGKTLEELKTWKQSEVLHPDDRDAVVRDWMRTISGSGHIYDTTHRTLRHDGVYRWMRARMFPQRDGNGTLVRWISLNTDVDDLKRAEALLAAEVRLFEMLARGRPLAEVLETFCLLTEELVTDCLASVLIKDPQARTLTVEAAPSFVGTEIDVLAIEPIDAGHCPCAASAILKQSVFSAELASDPRWASSQWPARMADLGVTACWSAPILSSSQQVLGVFSIYRRKSGAPAASDEQFMERFATIAGIAIERIRADVALKERERQLQQANMFLTDAQRLSKTGSFSWDFSAEEGVWSDESYRIFGIDPGTKIKRNLDPIHPDDRHIFQAHIKERQAVIEGKTAGLDADLFFRLVTPAGEVKHVHYFVHRNREIDDRVVFTGAIQDITEFKKAEEALNEARDELTHVTRAMTLATLTASMAHEISQPLAGILNNANTCQRMLAADPPNLQGAQTTVQRTVRDANRASEVIQRLRAMFAKKQPSMELVDLNEAVREVLALTSSELQRGKVMLRTEFTDDRPTVIGDRIQLEQVILNLVLNAADAMSGVNDRPRSLLLTTGLEETTHARLSVTDSGTGIDPQNIEKLFDAFYSTKPQGMGIGLSISRSIIETHKGRLWATPNDGPGATFSFSIPIQFGVSP